MDGHTAFKALIDSQLFAVLLADASQRITFANERFTRLSGYSLEDLAQGLGNPLDFSGLDGATQARVHAAMGRGEAVDCEQSLVARDGQPYHLAMEIKPLPDPAGGASGWLVIGYEVTDHVRLRGQFTAHAERLTLTLESARMGTWEVNGDKVIVDDSWLRLAGLTEADPARLGELWIAQIHPEDRAVMRDRISQAIGGSADVQTSRYRVERPDGTVWWAQDTSRVTERAADGSPVRLVGVITDITALKEAVDRAERTAERLWMAAEAANLGVWDHDLLAGQFFWSERMRDIHGLTAATESLEAYENLTHPDDRARIDAAMKIGQDLGQPFDLQFRIVRPGGEVRHVEVFSRMYKAADGRPCRAVGITRDITEQVRLAMERQQAQKLESIGQLAAGIAHEINTPAQYVSENLRFLADVLEPVTTLVRIVGESRPDHDLAHAMEQARQAIVAGHSLAEVPPAIAEALEGMERITSIVRAMNTFSHPANDRVAFDINKAIASTVTVARSEWKYVADVATEFEGDLPAVPVMPGAFNQVILNLLVNAAHAIRAGQGPGAADRGRITISTRRDGNHVEIVVGDNGCGMSPGIQSRIFDPFFTTKPVGQGTGQGLALAHAFVVKHQGSITVQSAPGQGARFTVRLPLQPGLGEAQ